MPQMAPMNWLSLYCILIPIFILFIIMFFLSLFINRKLTENLFFKSPVWKW